MEECFNIASSIELLSNFGKALHVLQRKMFGWKEDKRERKGKERRKMTTLGRNRIIGFLSIKYKKIRTCWCIWTFLVWNNASTLPGPLNYMPGYCNKVVYALLAKLTFTKSTLPKVYNLLVLMGLKLTTCLWVLHCSARPHMSLLGYCVMLWLKLTFWWKFFKANYCTARHFWHKCALKMIGRQGEKNVKRK